jgi:hypothetical protein
MHCVIAPCVHEECDGCADGDPVQTYFYLPMLRYMPTPSAGNDWVKNVLCLSHEGHDQLDGIVKAKGRTRGLIVQVSRRGDKPKGPMRVTFCQNAIAKLHEDAFDVRPVLTQWWARWLRDPKPDHFQPFLPFPEAVELPMIESGAQ